MADEENHQYAIYPSLRGKTVIVSGGARGIGAAVVEAFARQHAKVIFIDILSEEAEALLGRLEAVPRSGITRPTFYHCDLTDLEDLKSTTQRICEFNERIDVLVNNAASDLRGATAQVTPEDWDIGISVNLRHYFFLTQAVVPKMQEAGSGSIINLSSITWAVPSTGLPVYTTCKAAIMGMTRTHAHEFGPYGIRVNSVMPGSIATEREKRDILTPEYQAKVLDAQAIKRHLQPEDVARLILFLAADDSSAITNQSYVIDGGWV